jgi:hypothetical protein
MIGYKPMKHEVEAALKDYEKNQEKVDEIKQEIAGLKPGQCFTYPSEGLHGDMFRIVFTIAEKLPYLFRVWKYYNEVYIMREVE